MVAQSLPRVRLGRALPSLHQEGSREAAAAEGFETLDPVEDSQSDATVLLEPAADVPARRHRYHSEALPGSPECAPGLA